MAPLLEVKDLKTYFYTRRRGGKGGGRGDL